MRKKGIPETFVRAVMSLHKGSKIKVKVETHISEKFVVNVGVHHGSVLSALLFFIVIDVVRNEITEGTLQKILYANDLVLIAERWQNCLKVYTLKSALESKDLKVNQVKAKIMVSEIGQINIKPSSKKDPYGICGRKTMVNTLLCKSCGN